MIIKANGRDLTKQFQNSNYTLLTTNISIRLDNGMISALFLKPRKLHFSSIVYSTTLAILFVVLYFNNGFYFSNYCEDKPWKEYVA